MQKKRECNIAIRFLSSLIMVVSIVHGSQDKLYFCTAANGPYFDVLLNLIGSLHKTNFEDLGELAVFDIGLTSDQRNYLQTISKIRVCDVEKVNPEILTLFCVNNWGKFVPGWYAWKPVVIKQSLELYPYVLWLDAGTTVLGKLNNLFDYIKESGYFLCTIGQDPDPLTGKFPSDVNWQTTRYLVNKYNLESPERKQILAKEPITSCIIGISKNYIDKFILPMYELSRDLINYIDDGSTPTGFGTGRHDQALLSVIAYVDNLIFFRQDHKLEVPIKLNLNGNLVDFNITWHGAYLNGKTDIYTSRGDLSNYKYNTSFIKFKAD